MKNLRSTLMALALSIGIAGAFASSSKASLAKYTTYSWQHYDQSGTPVGPPVNGLTVNEARTVFGCPGSLLTKCAVALGGPTIYYN